MGKVIVVLKLFMVSSRLKVSLWIEWFTDSNNDIDLFRHPNTNNYK